MTGWQFEVKLLRALWRCADRSLEAGLLLVLPLVFWREFPEQFSSPKLFLARILIVIGLAAWGLNRIWATSGRMRVPAFVLPLGAVAMAVLLSCVNSPVPKFSLEEAEYFLCGPAFLLLLISAGDGEKAVRRMATLISLAAAAVAVVVLLQWAGHDPLLLGSYQVNWGKMGARMRLYGTLGNPNFVAGYLIGAIFPAMALGVASGARRRRVGWWAAAFAMLAAILGAGSKGAWVGLAMGVPVAGTVCWLGRRRAGAEPVPRVDVHRFAAGPIRSVAPLVAWFAAWLTLGAGDRLLRLAVGRMYLWRFSWPMFTEHPWLGGGFGVYQLRYLELQGRFLTAHPELTNFWTNNRQLHNDPLQLLLETGVLGFAAFVWLLSTYGGEIRRALRDSKVSGARVWIAASAGGVTAILVDSLVNFQFAVAPTFMLFFALLALPTLLRAGTAAPSPGEAVAPSEAGVSPHQALSRKLPGTVLRGAISLGVLLVAAALLVQTARHVAAERDLALAQHAESLGSLDSAEDLYHRGLALNPLSGRLHFGLARVLYLTDHLASALEEAQFAERTYADSHLEVLKARIRDRMGQGAAALADYRHALALDPTLKTVQADIERLSK